MSTVIKIKEIKKSKEELFIEHFNKSNKRFKMEKEFTLSDNGAYVIWIYKKFLFIQSVFALINLDYTPPELHFWDKKKFDELAELVKKSADAVGFNLVIELYLKEK